MGQISGWMPFLMPWVTHKNHKLCRFASLRPCHMDNCFNMLLPPLWISIYKSTSSF